MTVNRCAAWLDKKAPILVTGSAGFVGQRVVAALLAQGFERVRCLIRKPSGKPRLEQLALAHEASIRVEIILGNLLSREDCSRAVRDVQVILHLAAGRGEKSFPDAFMNSVVTTRNLLQAASEAPSVKRFVNVSSFAVYTNVGNPGGVLDETGPVETKPAIRGNAYCFAKVKQEDLVRRYSQNTGVPFVMVRPGVVYGPGNEQIHGRVGLGTFGVFLHLGGSNPIPLTYVDNCAQAIVLAGMIEGIEGQAFNVVDDDLPSSRAFLKLYKQNVRRFRSLYLPSWASYLMCYAWEKYSAWSQGQLPPAFNRSLWHATWKKTRYSNQRLKDVLGWKPAVSSQEGLMRHFASCRAKESHA